MSRNIPEVLASFRLITDRLYEHEIAELAESLTAAGIGDVWVASAEALEAAAREFPEYDLPFQINGRGVIHPTHWLHDRAARIRTSGSAA